MWYLCLIRGSLCLLYDVETWGDPGMKMKFAFQNMKTSVYKTWKELFIQTAIKNEIKIFQLDAASKIEVKMEEIKNRILLYFNI